MAEKTSAQAEGSVVRAKETSAQAEGSVVRDITSAQAEESVVRDIKKAETLPLHSRTPARWALDVLADPVALLADHAFLEKKAALNAMQLLERWPQEWVPGWVETMTSVARDEAAHLAQVTRILLRRGGRLGRTHRNPYANALRDLVRKGEVIPEALDRLFVSALIEARSCERFSVLATAAEDPELAALYKALFSSEFGHYKVFLRLAQKIERRNREAHRPQGPLCAVLRAHRPQGPLCAVLRAHRPQGPLCAGGNEARWQEMLAAEARILAEQEPGPRIHSGVRA